MVGTKRAMALWLPPSAWAGIIFILSSFQNPFGAEITSVYLDKVLHVIIYGILGALVMRAFRGALPDRPRLMLFLAAILAVSLYGALDEWHQSFVPGRDMSAADFISDVIGAFLGIIIYNRKAV